MGTRAGSPRLRHLRQRRLRLRAPRARLDRGRAQLLPAYAGLLLLDELEHLGRLLGDIERPFVLVSGGAKVEDKLGVLRNLGGRADTC